MATPINSERHPEVLRDYLLRWSGSRSIFPRRHEKHLLAVLRQLTAFTQSNAPLVPGLNACIAQASGSFRSSRPFWSKRRIAMWIFILLVIVPLNIAALYLLFDPFGMDSDVLNVAIGLLVTEVPILAVLLVRAMRRRNNADLASQEITHAKYVERAFSMVKLSNTLSRLFFVASITLVVSLYNAAIIAFAALWMHEVAIGLGALEAIAILFFLIRGAPDIVQRARVLAHLSILGHTVPTGQVAIYIALRERLESGQQLSEAMAGMHRFFPAHVAGQLRAAEASGRVAACLKRLADDLVTQGKARRKAPLQRAYLALVFLVGVVLGAFQMVKVIPVFVELYEDLDSKVPSYMKLLIDFGDFLLYKWPDLLTWASITFVLYLLVTRRIGFTQRLISLLVLRTPILGTATRFRNAAYATRALHELVRAEVPLHEALHATARAGLAPAFADTFARWQVRAASGATLSECARSGGAMPNGFAELALLGEHGDALPEAMAHATAMYEALADRAEHLLRTIAFPLALAPVAFAVYFFSVAIFEAVSGLSDALFYSL